MAVFLAVVFCGPSSDVQARTFTLAATLRTQDGTPPTSMPGYGTGRFIFDDQTRMLGYSLAFDALTTPVNVVDIHGPGTLQSGAPVIATLPIGDEPSHVGPYSGTLMLTPEQAAELLAGQFYIDIHTDLYRDGEIRGQIYLLPN